MSLSLLTNTNSLTAQRSLSQTTRSLQTSVARLSSGLRIVTASDDAAGLAVSERLSAQIRSYAQAQRNANDGISLLQTADSALAEIGDILGRLRELAVQASTESLGTTERTAAGIEFDQLVEEIDRIADVTEFNGITLLDGSVSGLSFQIGIGNTSSDQIDVTIDAAYSNDLGGGTPLQSANPSTVSGALAAIDIVDAAIDDVSAIRAGVGADQNRFTAALSLSESSYSTLSAARSNIRDADIAAETANFVTNSILMQAGVAVLAQANQIPGRVLDLLRFE